MGFAQLEKSVLEKAKKDAEKIIHDVKTRASKIKEEVKLETKELELSSEEEIKLLIDMLEKREIASCKLDSKKRILLTKKVMIDSVFDNVKIKLNKSLSKSERKKIIEKLVTQAKKEIDVNVIYCNKTDAEFVKGAKVTDMLGGIIAESKDGRVRVDYSFEEMIDDIREKHISEITKILFVE